MNILHIGNWVGGITTRNIAALKQWSHHRHELVVKIDHVYDMATEPAHLTEKNTHRDLVMQLASEAQILHYHASGYNGAAGLSGSIHDIDWSQFLGKKKFALHGMVSDLQPDGSWIKRHGSKFEVSDLHDYDLLMGPHPSCKFTYQDRLEYVPDMFDIHAWLYTPVFSEKQNVAVTFKNPEVVALCQREGLDLRLMNTPTKLTAQLEFRRRVCKATFDNATDGHDGLFGLESLAHGIPCITYVHPMNRERWALIGVPPPPFIECGYGGGDVPRLLRNIFNMPKDEWNDLSMRCRSWVEEFGNPEHLSTRWDEVYDSLSCD